MIGRFLPQSISFFILPIVILFILVGCTQPDGTLTITVNLQMPPDMPIQGRFIILHYDYEWDGHQLTADVSRNLTFASPLRQVNMFEEFSTGYTILPESNARNIRVFCNIHLVEGRWERSVVDLTGGANHRTVTFVLDAPSIGTYRLTGSSSP